VIDLAAHASEWGLARAVREALRLRRTTVAALAEGLGGHRGRRGTGRVAVALARYTGLPVERARSATEVRALELLRDAGRRLPLLNARIAGEEADLSWPDQRLIVEIDGAPFHLDQGEDARKQARWEAAGWVVRRLPSDSIYRAPAARAGAVVAQGPNVH
jgi:hypothetical protein